MAKPKRTPFVEQLTAEFESSSGMQPEELIANFRNLKQHAGWREAIEVFSRKEAELKGEILDSDVGGEELARLRDRRDLLVYFINLPDILIEALSRSSEARIPEFDPYEKEPKPPIDGI